MNVCRRHTISYSLYGKLYPKDAPVSFIKYILYKKEGGLMKKTKILSSILAAALLCALLPLSAFAADPSTISVVLLGNNGTAVVADEYSESVGLVWQAELVNGNKVGTDTIAHINAGPFDETNLKAGYLVTANQGYYIDAFYRCEADYNNKENSLDKLDLEDESLYTYNEQGYLINGVITELTWPNEKFYISFKEIPEETETLSLVIAGNRGTVTNNVGDYTTSSGIKWQSKLSGGNKIGTDTLTLEHQAPWGEAVDGVKTGYLVTAKEGYYIKALYPDQGAYDAKQPVDADEYSNVVKNTDGNITSCRWVWYAEPKATVYFTFERIPGNDYSVKDSDAATGVRLEATTNELPEDTALSVSIIKSGEEYDSVNIILGDSVNGIVAYDISLLSNNVTVQPEGFVKVNLPIPDNFDLSSLTVYYVDTEKNTKKSYEVTVETIDGIKYASFETYHFSTFVLAERAAGDVSRTAGGNRYDTSAKTALQANPNGAETVIIARGDDQGNFADGLAASYLAGLENAPILLTTPGSLPQEIKDAIKQLKAKKAYVLGGELAVSQAVENSLKNLGLQVERITGQNRYATAAAIAAKGGQTDTAVVVSGFAPADSLVAGPLAFSRNYPILLAGKNSVPAETKQAMADLGIKEIIVVGGENAVSNAVYNELGAHERCSGHSRIETSLAVAKKFFETSQNISIVGYLKLADAVGAAVSGNPIIYVKNDISDVEDYLTEATAADTNFTIFGGTLAVDIAVENALKGLLTVKQKPV
jgi:putative cell wall-binding protein